jgi:hypothetical protein
MIAFGIDVSGAAGTLAGLALARWVHVAFMAWMDRKRTPAPAIAEEGALPEEEQERLLVAMGFDPARAHHIVELATPEAIAAIKAETAAKLAAIEQETQAKLAAIEEEKQARFAALQGEAAQRSMERSRNLDKLLTNLGREKLGMDAEGGQSAQALHAMMSEARHMLDEQTQRHELVMGPWPEEDRGTQMFYGLMSQAEREIMEAMRVPDELMKTARVQTERGIQRTAHARAIEILCENFGMLPTSPEEKLKKRGPWR